VFEVAAAASCQRFLERRRPLLVGFGESPYLIGRQPCGAKHRPERLAGIDPIEKLSSYLCR
jgi:hypothetical protein